VSTEFLDPLRHFLPNPVRIKDGRGAVVGLPAEFTRPVPRAKLPSGRSFGREFSWRMPEHSIEVSGPECSWALILGKTQEKRWKWVEKGRAGCAKKNHKFLLTPAPNYD